MNRPGVRWWWLLLLVPLVAGLWRLRFDTEVLSLLPASVPEVRGLQLYQRHFTDARELVLTLRADDPEAATRAAQLLATTLRAESNLVARAVWQPPWAEHPEILAEFIAALWLNQPPTALAALNQRLAPDQLAAVATAARDRLATSFSPGDFARLGYDPFGLSQLPASGAGAAALEAPEAGFASLDGTFRAVFVEARGELPDYRACGAWLAAVAAVVTRVEQSPDWPAGVRVGRTGSPAFVSEIAQHMEADMKWSVLAALGCIVALFWWAHRSWRPLAWLILMLGLVAVGALAAGGLVLGTLNAVSLGFAAILLGLAVDSGLVVYAEAVARPGTALPDLRRQVAPVLWWSAITTAAAFLLLNAAGLPGLSQLGTLVGAGILFAPPVMLWLFLPRVAQPGKASSSDAPASAAPPPTSGNGPRGLGLATGLAALLALAVIARCGVPFDHTNRPLEPQHLPAQQALDELQRAFGGAAEPLLVLVAGADEAQVARRLAALETQFAEARQAGAEFTAPLPTPLWPHPDWQAVNRPIAAALAARAPALRAAADAAGFTPEASEFTTRVLGSLARLASAPAAAWPTNEAARWLLRRAAARTPEGWLAAGAITPGTQPLDALVRDVNGAGEGVWLTSWKRLGTRLATHVERRIGWIAVVIVGVVAVCLRLAFGRWREVGLSLALVGFALLLLQAGLSVAGYAWNLMSLAAVPLLLGAGVDYTLHVQWALRRHSGDARAMRRVTGRALLLCAATSVAGFGSTAFSSHPGLASLGLTCALGLALMCATALLVLPAWWQRCAGGPAIAPLARPSAAYGPLAWRLGMMLVRWLPRGLCRALGRVAAGAYRVARPARFAVLVENLRPLFAGDRTAARRAAGRLLGNFALKITDLLRHEGGGGDGIAVSRWSGYELLQAALERRRGVLLVTPHLGNWEFGGVLLAQKGVRLVVLTQAEPGRGFTEMRQRARARWGIETLVVGQDAFAFVEIIKRLQEGAVVALLVDRPPPNSAVATEFCGRTFQTSIAPAELARASGCAVVPVYVVAEGGGYAAHVLPEVAYDRRALGDREARRRFAGEILRVFEPVIRQHPDQWYHFVPLWRGEEE